MVAIVEFRILGSVEVADGGLVKDLGGLRERTLLARLLLAGGQVVSADRLADDLWAGQPPPHYLATLRVYISRLRRALGTGSDAVATYRPGTGSCWPTASSTRSGSRRWRPRRPATWPLAARKRPRPGCAKPCGCGAGPALSDVADFEFAQADVGRLRRPGWPRPRTGSRPTWPAAVTPRWPASSRAWSPPTRCGSGCAASGCWPCTGAAARPTRCRPTRTCATGSPTSWASTPIPRWPGCRRRSCARTGAGLASRRARGPGPGRGTRAGPASRKRRRPGPAAGPAGPGGRAAPGWLPAETTSFIGRESELATIEELLGLSRLLTLTGPGGSGKTRLALKAGEQATGRYPGGVWLVELAPVTGPDLVTAVAASALGIREEPGHPLADTIAAHLRDRAALLILDCCEHVLDAAASLVTGLLRQCPSLRVLATSQTRLGVAGEASWPVPPLTRAARPADPRVGGRGRVGPAVLRPGRAGPARVRADRGQRGARSARSAGGSTAYRWPSSSPRRGSAR